MTVRLSGVLVLAGAAVLLLAAVLVTVASPMAGLLVCVVLAGALGLVVVGLERAGLIALVGAFATAPAYRGLAGLTGGVGTPTDLLVLLAALLLLPIVISRRLRLPSPYVAGLVLVAVTGLVASVASATAAGSLVSLAQWLFFIGALPILVAWWRPGTTTIVVLLWAYVAGQAASTAYALASGPVVGDRYEGLSHHPNAFGMAGMTAIAILLYLVAHHRGPRARAVVVVAAAVSATSTVLSGSRAAVVVAVVLVLLVPLVERSAVSGFVFAVVGGLALIAFPLLVQSGHAGSALSRLAGQGTASAADRARIQGFDEGVHRFLDSPILGSGLVDVEPIHNVLLEVAVGVGVFGLVGWLMVMFVLSRTLLTNHVHRRLGYLPVAFVGMVPALPGIWDRTMWVPIALAILATQEESSTEQQPTGAEPVGTSRPTSREVVRAHGAPA